MAESTDGWPTKAEAAQALGVTTKTLEKYVQQGKLRQAMQSQINKPARVVIDPEALERMISERSAVVHVPQNQQVEHSQKASANIPELLSVLAARSWPPALYMTEPEAIRYTGLGRGYLRSKLTPQKIGPRGALVYRRKDLEEL